MTINSHKGIYRCLKMFLREKTVRDNMESKTALLKYVIRFGVITIICLQVGETKQRICS